MTFNNFLRKPEQLEQTAKPTTPPPLHYGDKYSDNDGRLLINGKVLALTKHFEGLEIVARDDGYGTPTIGYGRIKYPNGKKVKNGETCTEQEAEKWLLYDLYDEGAKYVRAYLKDDIENAMSDDEFSVWVDLSFNRGCGRFREFIAGHLNKGDKQAALAALVGPGLTSAGGRYSLGLDRRRWAERMILEGKPWEPFKSIDYFKRFKAAGYR